MVEVTRKNFINLLPEITEKIHNATFVAVDAEYTGIYSEDLHSANRLFDTGPERYLKLRENAIRFTVSQYGLAIFRKDGPDNVYKVDAYKFYLFPLAFESFAKREVLSLQVSCINFLARHNFDFNKFLKEGIPYLNMEKLDSLRSFLKENRHFMNIAESLNKDYFPEDPQILSDDDIEAMVDRLTGFSKIIDVISKKGIPVVGHNFLIDLLMTYQQFYENLPSSYKRFKASVRELFPVIYDTKYLAREVHFIRNDANPDDIILADSNLFTLYTNTCATWGMNLPVVKLNGGATVYKQALTIGRGRNLETVPMSDLGINACHSADFDAIITGCVFLNICTLAVSAKTIQDYRKSLPPTFSELVGRTECWSNRVNVARAVISYIDTSGPDPKPHRPNWIVANSADIGKFINANRLKMELVKYGDLEIQMVSDTEVVIACGGIGTHRKVWKDLLKRGFTLREKCFSSSFTIFSLTWGKLWGIALAVGALYLGRRRWTRVMH